LSFWTESSYSVKQIITPEKLHRAIGFVHYSQEAEPDKVKRNKYEEALKEKGVRGVGAAS